MNYGKMLDLFDLAMKMQESSDGISLADICRDFDVSQRTAERMRDALLRYFPQMEEVNTGEKRKRWRIPQRTLNSLIAFSPEEISALQTAISYLKQNSLDDKAALLAKVELKLKNLMKPEQKRRVEVDAEELIKAEGLVLRPGPKIKIDAQIIDTIRQAILSCHQVRLKYKSKMDGRIFDYNLIPYGFLYGQRAHYLVAKHSDGWDSGKAHNFSLSHILEADILPETFINDDFNLEAYAQESFGAWHEKPFDVEWLFSPKVAEEAKTFIFHPNQTFIENPDGSLTVKFRAGGKLEMDWFLYTWGDEVKVIKPETI